MKLNADVGEGAWTDEALMPWIDWANIACGEHAGGTEEMKRTVALAMTHGVIIGAHPGYPDRDNFGRISIPMAPGDITRLVADQVENLNTICQLMGAQVAYIKPHGALYHDMMQHPHVFEEILHAASGPSNPLPVAVMAQAGEARLQHPLQSENVPLVFEAFADRAYAQGGGLMDRAQAGAVFDSVGPILAQVQHIVNHNSVTTANDTSLAIKADSICVHGDNPASIAAIHQIFHLLHP